MHTNELRLDLTSPGQLVTVQGDHLVTDSRIVAKYFGKAHKNVLRIIDDMRMSSNPEIAQHSRLNFEPCMFDYKTGKGGMRSAPGYRMTKDGLSELAMSFTGDRARLCRIRFIAAFNQVAEELAVSEKNLWQKMQALIAKETQSQVKAAFGSRLMNLRRREIRPLRAERAELETALQPSLLN
jgi:Rha family phage regulatory protein